MKHRIFIIALSMALVLGLVSGCGQTASGDIEADPDPGYVAYDDSMLTHDGVLLVRNTTSVDVTGLCFSFDPASDIPESAFSDRIQTADDGLVHILMDDAPAGGESELDVSGFLHMYMSRDSYYYFSCIDPDPDGPGIAFIFGE